MKLAEVKARKERVEQLVSLLTAMRSEDAAMASDAASPKKKEEDEREGEGEGEDASARKEQPQVATPPPVAGDNSIGLSSEALGRGGGRSELVDDREISRMAELHERMQ